MLFIWSHREKVQSREMHGSIYIIHSVTQRFAVCVLSILSMMNIARVYEFYPSIKFCPLFLPDLNQDRIQHSNIPSSFNYFNPFNGNRSFKNSSFWISLATEFRTRRKWEPSFISTQITNITEATKPILIHN